MAREGFARRPGGVWWTGMDEGPSLMTYSAADAAKPGATSGGWQSEPFPALVHHLLVYKTWVAGAAVSGLLATGVALCFIPPRYEAQAVLIVDSRRDKLADSEGALSSIVIDQYQSSLKSELELIRSDDLARHVIVSLDLLDTPEYDVAKTHVSMASRFAALREWLVGGIDQARQRLGWRDTAAASPMTNSPPPAADAPPLDSAAVLQNAVKIFQKTFWVENDSKSLTIRMGYRSTSPELAAAVTNAALRRYLAADEEVKAAAADRSQEWLQERIANLRREVDLAERAVEDFRAENDLATDRDHSPLQQQLLQLENRRVDAQAALAAAQARAARTRPGVGLDEQASDVLASVTIQKLRQQEAALMVQHANMAATVLPNYPGMVQVADQLKSVRSALRSEIARIAQSNQSDLHLAELQLADVSTQAELVRAKIATSNAADIKLRSLQADADAKRAVLSSFTKRYDQDAGVPLTPPDSRVASWASVPVDASSPKYGLMLAAGTLASCFAAFVLTMGIERLRRGFDSLEEVEEELGLVVAGVTPTLPRKHRRNGRSETMISAPMRDFAVTVRALATRSVAGASARVLMMASAVAGEGKSDLALSLARNVAGAGQRCLLIDADIRNPSLHAILGAPATPGLVELSVDRQLSGSVIRRPTGEAFDFLAAGRPTPDVLGAFTVDGFGGALSELKRSYDVIVIDSAPILLASESLVLLGFADLTLFLVKWRTTPREASRKAAQLLARCSAGTALAVLSQVDLRRARRRRGGYAGDQYRGVYRAA